MKRSAKSLAAFFLIDVKKNLAFSTATISNIFATVALAVVQISLWRFIDHTNGVDYIVRYFALVAFMRPLYDLRVDRTIEELHRSGKIVYDLLRPRPFVFTLLLRSFASSINTLLTISIPSFVGVALVYRIDVSAIRMIPLFLASLAFGYLTVWLISYAVGCSTFPLKDANGVLSAYHFLLPFFAGAIVPFDALPDAVRSVFLALPFRAGYDIPIRVANAGSIVEAGGHLVVQVVWLLAVTAVAYFAQTASLRRIEIYGG